MSSILINPISPLRHVHAATSGVMAFGKGGGPSTQTVQQTNLPDYAQPYFEGLLERARDLSFVDYAPYPKERLADFNTDVLNSFNMARGVAGSGIEGLGTAQDVVTGNINRAQQLANAANEPYQFSQADFQAMSASPYAGFQETQGQEYQFSPTERFSGAAIEEYMSPYMQAVVDRQQENAMQRFRELGGERAARAVQAGAFGGSRQAVQESLAERDLMNQLADIQASGTQQAFEQAAQQFGADRAADFARQQAQAGEGARVQGIGAQEAARVQAARAAELARTQGISIAEANRVQAQEAAEQARVQAAQAAENRAAQQQQLQALGFSSEQAAQLASFGEMGRAADIQGSQLLEAIGKSQMGQEQQMLDMAYQDFIRQQAYPEQQLQMYSSILRGVPVQPGITTTAYTPYNPLQQALGAGLGAIGLYRGLSA